MSADGRDSTSQMKVALWSSSTSSVSNKVMIRGATKQTNLVKPGPHSAIIYALHNITWIIPGTYKQLPLFSQVLWHSWCSYFRLSHPFKSASGHVCWLLGPDQRFWGLYLWRAEVRDEGGYWGKEYVCLLVKLTSEAFQDLQWREIVEDVRGFKLKEVD